MRNTQPTERRYGVTTFRVTLTKSHGRETRKLTVKIEALDGAMANAAADEMVGYNGKYSDFDVKSVDEI
jgi:plasmid replication initiation protein